MRTMYALPRFFRSAVVPTLLASFLAAGGCDSPLLPTAPSDAPPVAASATGGITRLADGNLLYSGQAAARFLAAIGSPGLQDVARPTSAIVPSYSQYSMSGDDEAPATILDYGLYVQAPGVGSGSPHIAAFVTHSGHQARNTIAYYTQAVGSQPSPSGSEPDVGVGEAQCWNAVNWPTCYRHSSVINFTSLADACEIDITASATHAAWKQVRTVPYEWGHANSEASP